MIVTTLVSLLLCGAFPQALPVADPLPQGPGLASRYPGDDGLSAHPSVILVEGFEVDAIEELEARWESISNQDGRVLGLSDDVPAPGSGRRSLQLTAHPGADTGGHLYRRLPRAADKAFVRFYVKFPKSANYVHHFVHFGGYNPATPWPQGGAGERPRGDDRVTVGIEPFGRNGSVPPPGEWNFYAYWHEMKISAGNRYWGNGLSPARPQAVPEDRWQCVEAMLQLNDVGKPNGRLALWLDGALVADIHEGVARDRWTGMGFNLVDRGGEPFEGFDFRTSDDLKINFFWLLYYVTEQSLTRNKVDDPGRPCIVLFDHVVVATEYLGPLTPIRTPSD